MARHLEPRAWARACGAARSLYAARVRIARARPSTMECPSEWAVEQWPAAHSLFLDLRAVAAPPRLPQAADAADGGAGAAGPVRPALLRQRWALPALRCLHLIYGVSSDERAAAQRAWFAARARQGGAYSGLGLHNSGRWTAKDAAAAAAALLGNMALPALRALSLDMTLMEVLLPGSLAGLRHLALRLDSEHLSLRSDRAHEYDAMFEAIASGLPELRSLYIEAENFFWIHADVDLEPCQDLRALALANVYVAGRVALPPPAYCSVAAALPLDALEALRARPGDNDADRLRKALTALDVRSSDFLPRATQDDLDNLSRVVRNEYKPRLGELRIGLHPDAFTRRAQDHVLELDISASAHPCLRVLEVRVPCTLRLRLSGMRNLTTLVVEAHALAEFAWIEPESGVFEHAAGHPWEEVSVRIATPPPVDVASALRDLFTSPVLRRDSVFGAMEGEGCAWRGASPAAFRPGGSCACRACLACLGRAGVPLAAPQAWRREDFDRLLAPLCRCARGAARLADCCFSLLASVFTRVCARAGPARGTRRPRRTRRAATRRPRVRGPPSSAHTWQRGALGARAALRRAVAPPARTHCVARTWGPGWVCMSALRLPALLFTFPRRWARELCEGAHGLRSPQPA